MRGECAESNGLMAAFVVFVLRGRRTWRLEMGCLHVDSLELLIIEFVIGPSGQLILDGAPGILLIFRRRVSGVLLRWLAEDDFAARQLCSACRQLAEARPGRWSKTPRRPTRRKPKVTTTTTRSFALSLPGYFNSALSLRRRST